MALMWSSKQNFISFSLIYGTHFKNVVDEKLFAVFFYSVLAFNGFCSTIHFFAHLMLHCWAKCKVLKWVCKHITGFYIHLFSKNLLSRIERPFGLTLLALTLLCVSIFMKKIFASFVFIFHVLRTKFLYFKIYWSHA